MDNANIFKTELLINEEFEAPTNQILDHGVKVEHEAEESSEGDPLDCFIDDFHHTDDQIEEEDTENSPQIKAECLVNDESKVAENTISENMKKPKTKKGERLTCDLCGKTFCNKTSIRNHMEKIHKNSENKPPRKKRKSKKNPENLKKEKIENTTISAEGDSIADVKTEETSTSPKPEMPQPIQLECGFGCPICSKEFSQKRYVEEHIRGVHFKIPRKNYNKTKKKYIYNRLCSICGESFNNISSYRSHYKRHFPEQCLSCRYCGKIFTGASILKIHELIHTGEKPFKCEICDFRCNAKNWLKVI